MKAVIIHPDGRKWEKLTGWLEDRGHIVLAAQPDFSAWLAIFAEHEPELAVLGGAVEQADMIMAQHSFPDCEFALLDEETGWEAAVAAAEKARAGHNLMFRRVPERRLVLQAEGYNFSLYSTKLHRPVREPGWEEVAKRQEALFVLQLQAAAAGGHERAKRYYSILRRSHRSLLQECTYRLGHGSYKIAWLREELARWATVLCCYLPDAQIGACPHPQNASPDVVFLHHGISATYLYPVMCVLRFGVQPALSEQIKRAATWSFTGEPEGELAKIGLMLFGLNSYLAEIAHAQITCMDQFLAADSDYHSKPDVRRGLDRAIGAILEFWGWPYLQNMGGDLRIITKKVLTGETRVEYEKHPFLPSFREFQEMVRQPSKPPTAG